MLQGAQQGQKRNLGLDFDTSKCGKVVVTHKNMCTARQNDRSLIPIETPLTVDSTNLRLESCKDQTCFCATQVTDHNKPFSPVQHGMVLAAIECAPLLTVRCLP